MNEKTEPLINECKQIEADSMYTAETHHIIAGKASSKSFYFRLIPAIITVAGAYCLLQGANNWVAWITLLAGILTIFNVFAEFDYKAREHLFAAKKFTVLKHNSRVLYESFRHFIEEKEFYHEVRLLRDRYNMLVESTPATDDEEAFNKARDRIKKGVHKADFRKK
ncbi:MAG: SLATT domain-containing protein [Candidatus Gorgyraea atricola]|nr:SLATT domain-containing protein [Candidatus Gorgyraea atricola]